VLESIGDIELEDPKSDKGTRKPSKTTEREAAAAKDGKQ
jgi:hypothetical protein